jgi:hypothetical protein
VRSKSDHPLVVANREVLHKIGVTGGDVSRRVGTAKLDPTFLMADVEIVATYNLFNINRARLENLIHRIFDPAWLEVKDRFGNPVIPREWFSCHCSQSKRRWLRSWTAPSPTSYTTHRPRA